MGVDRETLIDTARRVIGIEARGLSALQSALGPAFADAVEVILAARGRVIVTGMGKSGHIARKIAATLASTGTPAHYVHPAEAGHGDLGMLTTDDVVLVLSYSGETAELSAIISHTGRFRIPMIGVAGRADSTLLRACDVALVLPEADEACGTGNVPTTSTTMMLALGDAISVALMEHRGFTAADFRDFHPGGRLGARLSRVRDLMHGDAELPLVSEDAPMPDVLLTISRKGFGVAGVTGSDGRLSGIITDGDLRRHMDGLLDRRAADVMTRQPMTVLPDALAVQALGLMNERKITCLFAVDETSGKPQGILHIHDCLRAGIS